jgi:uncharacterized phiE125 gp8 family phage protein
MSDQPRFRLVRVQAPAELPVTVAEARRHLSIDGEQDDALLTDLIRAATEVLDGPAGRLGRAVITQRWDAIGSGFVSVVRLPLPSLRAVVSVSYLDASRVLKTLDSSAYRVAGIGGRGELRPVASWPVLADDPEAVTIRFEAGYGTAADVPQRLKTAILTDVAARYAVRERVFIGQAAPREVASGYDELVSDFIAWDFG